MKSDGHYSGARVRKSVVQFIGGKIGSAALNFFAFMLVVRVLSTSEYGYYVSALAIVELLLAFSSLGLDWVVARYIPEYRVHASGARLRAFIRRLAMLQAGLFCLAGLMLGLFAQSAASILGIGDASKGFLVYAGYVAVEGTGRMLRDQMLNGLMQQGWAQFIMIMRNSVWVLGLLWLLDTGEAADIVAVGLVELFAATIALLAGIALLFLGLRKDGAVEDPAWHEPAKREMLSLAGGAYASYLLSLGYGVQVLTLLLTRFSGVDVAAAFGFARNLSEQVRKYLPTDLLLGIVRPALISRYSLSRDFATFSGNVGSFFRFGCIALLPLVLLAVVFGNQINDVLGYGKFPGSWVFLSLLFIGLAPFSHRKVVELLANSVASADVCVRANALMITVPIIVAGGLYYGAPAWLAVVVMIGAECLFNTLVVMGLRARGFFYDFPWLFVLKVVAAIVLSIPILIGLPIHAAQPMALILSTILVSTVGFAILWLLRPLDVETQRLIKLFLKK